MQIRKFFAWCGKALRGGIIAFIVLSLFCLFYSHFPSSQPNPYGTTDFTMESNHFYISYSEGFGYGKTNNEGFIQTLNYAAGMPIDVLVMGSSHVLGYHVPQKKTITAQLSEMMPESTVYSIGMSNHTFLTCCSNLEAALKRYKPAKAVVIETSQVDFSVEQIREVIQGTFPEIVKNYNGVRKFFSKIDLLKLSYDKLNDFLTLSKQNTEENYIVPNDNLMDTEHYLENLDSLFNTMQTHCEEWETNLIIFYHPYLDIDEEGKLIFATDTQKIQMFQECCERHEIIFVDLTESFLEMYNDEHKLPYGFYNTQAGKGHLNINGCKLVAEELFDAVKTLD